MTDDLTSLKDDMIAFVEGHGMRRFAALVNDELPSVMWDPGENPDAWKDFVELAKSANAPFLTMNSFTLTRKDVDYLVDQLRNSMYTNEDDVEDARLMRTNIDRCGFVQLGFPFQGLMFLYEISTEWHDRYQNLLELADEFGGVSFTDLDQEDDR